MQFIPTFNSLTEEAIRCAEVVDIDGVPLKVVRAEHLAAIASRSARPKDFARVLALLKSEAVSRDALTDLASRHGLGAAGERSVQRFLA